MRAVLLLTAAAALMAFQSPPGPAGQPHPAPWPIVTPVPTPSATPSGAPTPPINDQSLEAKDAGDSGTIQGGDRPPKPRAGI